MTNTNSALELGKRIEQLIEEYIAASRAAAQAAVATAFAASNKPTSAPRRTRSSSGKKRPSADIAALGEQFYKAVCAKPGQTMTVLAADIGASARALRRSVSLLRRAGRVRAVGNRSLTRYFPMASEAVASS